MEQPRNDAVAGAESRQPKNPPKPIRAPRNLHPAHPIKIRKNQKNQNPIPINIKRPLKRVQEYLHGLVSP